MRLARGRLGREDGFTLMELVVVLPMLTIVLGGIVLTLTTLTRWSGQSTEQAAQQATVRSALDSVMRGLRSTMPATQGGVPLVSADSTSITFYTPDRVTASSGANVGFHLQEVAYRFSGGALQTQSVRSSNTFSQVVSTVPWTAWTSTQGGFPVSNFPFSTGWQTLVGTGSTSGIPTPPLVSASFTYYDASGTVVASPVSAANLKIVRSVQVDVTASSGGSQSRRTNYSATATIRENQLG